MPQNMSQPFSCFCWTLQAVVALFNWPASSLSYCPLTASFLIPFHHLHSFSPLTSSLHFPLFSHPPTKLPLKIRQSYWRSCFATNTSNSLITFSFASGFRIIRARCAMAPASTTVCASSSECLQMSLKDDAATRFSANSGSWRQRMSRGTAPASTTAWDNSMHHQTILSVTISHAATVLNMEREKNANWLEHSTTMA